MIVDDLFYYTKNVSWSQRYYSIYLVLTVSTTNREQWWEWIPFCSQYWACARTFMIKTPKEHAWVWNKKGREEEDCQQAKCKFLVLFIFFLIIFTTFDEEGGVLNMLTRPHGCIQYIKVSTELREHFYRKLSHGQWWGVSGFFFQGSPVLLPLKT